MEQVKIYTLSGPKGVRYVGKTIQSLKVRLSAHTLEKGRNRKQNWIKSLKSKGIKPTIEILDIVDEDVWEEREIYWIQQFKDWGFDLVNTQLGGGNDGQHSNKSVQQLDRCTGEIIDTFKSIKEAYIKTNATNINRCLAGKRMASGGFAWKYTDDKDYIFVPTKKRNYKVKNSIVSSNINQLDKDTEEVIATFNSITEASKVTGVDSSKICQVCKGKRKSASGYKWRYVGDKYYTAHYKKPKPHSVQQLDKYTGEVVATFKNIVRAHKATGMSAYDILEVCKGNREHASGYKWRYTPTK
jgi:hypothetical protein